jgi:hypothetical protein
MYSPAYKVKAEDIVFGRCETDQSGLSLVTPWGVRVRKVRILGTIVQKYVKEDGTYSFVNVDDGTGVVRVKAWRDDVRMLQPLGEGDIVDVIGRIRLNERDGEVYIVPDLILKVEDPNVELLRELEIIEERLRLLGSGVRPGEGKPSHKEMVVAALRQSDEGMTADEISRATGIPMDELEGIIRDLLAEGRIAEKTSAGSGWCDGGVRAASREGPPAGAEDSEGDI